MDIQKLLDNAKNTMEKSAADEAGVLEEVLAKFAFQGREDALTEIAEYEKDAAVTPEQTAAFISESKAQDAVLAGAQKILLQNKSKPGGLTLGGQHQDVPNSGGGMEEAEGSEEKLSGYDSFVEHVVDAATPPGYDGDEKVACFICQGNACGVCEMTGELKLAEAEELWDFAEKTAQTHAALTIEKFAEAGVALAGPELDSLDYKETSEGITQAQAAVDAAFSQLWYDHPSSGVPDFGGSNDEFNHLLNLLKPNRSNELTGQ